MSIFIITLTKIYIFLHHLLLWKKIFLLSCCNVTKTALRSIFWLFWVNEMQLKSGSVIKHWVCWYQKAAIWYHFLVKATSEYAHKVTSTTLILTWKSVQCAFTETSLCENEKYAVMLIRFPVFLIHTVFSRLGGARLDDCREGIPKAPI